jgi:hypothetical protein
VIDASRIQRREEQTRKVIRNLHVSDARWRHPLGPEKQGFYDLMVSGFCLDAVSSDKRIWHRCMSNVLSTLHEGGLLILHALYRCKAYKVGERMFPSTATRGSWSPRHGRVASRRTPNGPGRHQKGSRLSRRGLSR